MFHPHAIPALYNPPFFSFLLLLTHTSSMYGGGRRKGKEGGKNEEGKGRRHSYMPNPLAPDPIRVNVFVVFSEPIEIV